MKLQSRIILFTLILIVLATVSKLLFAPKIEMSGFSPIIAIALFSGMIVKEKSKSFLLPLLALLISDVLIQIVYEMGLFPFAGLYKYQLLNYAILLFATLIGWMLRGKNYTSIFAGAIAGPTIFFLVSNFFVWAQHFGYQRPMTFEGLLLCFEDGLPFYKNALIATLIYLPVLMVSYNLIVKRNNSLKLS
jgi:hypothetical protein